MTFGKSESIFHQKAQASEGGGINRADKDEYISPDGRTPVEHYIRDGIECIDVMRAISTPEEFQAHCKLTAFKYLYRLGQKDDPAREVKKAQDYLMWLRQSLESNPR